MNFYDDIARFGEAAALITEELEHLSYRALVQAADGIRAKLSGRCLVFCVCQNSLESIVGYVGFLRGRTVPVLISNALSEELFRHLMETYRPRYLWLPFQKARYAPETNQVYSLGDYVLLRTRYRIDYALHDNLALLLTTSGSTGSPKLVRQSYRNIDSNARSIAEYLAIEQKDRPITTMPMSYTYGLSIINSHLLKGASIILTGKSMMDRTFWELLKEEEATTFGGVPYIYEMLKKLRFAKMDLPSLKVLTQAGGRLSPELSLEFAEVCEKKGIRFVVMYGQTEATARMSYLPETWAVTKAGSIGVAIPGGEFWLEDDRGNVIPGSGVAGELVYKGDNVTMGYAENCYDLAKGDENQGVLRTGDMARRDVDGFYYIVGRKRRFLKLFGSRINLDEVESLLMSQGYECACAGQDDCLRVFTLQKDQGDEIRKFLKTAVGINSAGLEILEVDSIPHNEAGKVLYSVLEQTFAS